jgi:CRP-like cAMP-binding protein
MDATFSSIANPLIRKLESLIDLSDDERQALMDLPMTVRAFKADQDIVRDGERPSHCCLMVEGFACRYKLLHDGRRQIFSFHIPGDVPDLQSLHLTVTDHSIGTLVPSMVAFIPHPSLRDFNALHPRIAGAFWRDTLVDAAVFREWMIGIGRRTAYSRIAHVFCELLVRYRAVDMADGNVIRLSATQAELGDALGLSTVHVNRVLQDLRADGLITLRGGSLDVLDWEGLKQAGEFDPAYLHLKDGEAS